MGIQQNLADMMYAFKKERNLSDAEFSETLEISRSTLQDYLHGRGNPSVATLEHMAERLDVDPLVLVSGAFRADQTGVVLLLFRTVKGVLELSADKRRRFAALFVQMVSLWEQDREAG